MQEVPSFDAISLPAVMTEAVVINRSDSLTPSTNLELEPLQLLAISRDVFKADLLFIMAMTWLGLERQSPSLRHTCECDET